MPLTALWFIVPLAQLAVVGVAGSAPLWQIPQSTDAATGMCGGVVMPAAAEVLPLVWQPEAAQPDVTPVWLKLVTSFHVVKPVAEWQLEQSTPFVATWPGNDAVPCAPEVP